MGAYRFTYTFEVPATSPFARTLTTLANATDPAPGGMAMIAALRAKLDQALSGASDLQFEGNSGLEGPAAINDRASAVSG